MTILVSCLLAAAVTGGLCCLFWYNENVWRPRRKLKLLSKGPLADLAPWGFEPTYQAFAAELTGGAAKAPVAMIGTIQGYAVEASFGWADEEYLMIRVFFEPPTRDYEAIMQNWQVQQALTKKWKFAKGFLKAFNLFCAPVYIDATFFYTNKPPEATKLILLSEQIINELKELQRPPLGYIAACELANEVLRESRHRTATRKLTRWPF